MGCFACGIDSQTAAAEQDLVGMLFDFLGTAIPSHAFDRLVWQDGTDIFIARNCYRKVLHCRLRLFYGGNSFIQLEFGLAQTFSIKGFFSGMANHTRKDSNTRGSITERF